MRLESVLCHSSDNKAVVKVEGWINDKSIGSALGEGKTVEIAEDNAIFRLKKRIMTDKSIDQVSNKTNQSNSEKKTQVNLANNETKAQLPSINSDPEDWSKELIEIELEINRLKWTRDEENEYLEKNLGYNSRSQITKYADIIKYLKMLKDIHGNNLNQINEIDTNKLLNESEKILKELCWDYRKGREYLQNEFKVSTRKALDPKQLIQFVDKLKSIRDKNILDNNMD